MLSWLRSGFHRLFEDQFDVALSLNGTDPDTVEVAEQLVHHLQRHRLRVFFYRDPEKLRQTWGTTSRRL